MLRVVLLAALVALCLAATADQWKSRTIYQLLTDRFATSDGSNPGCVKSTYCGGTWIGIKNKLDYIAAMGFDAIWISPILRNTANGYHGYWAKEWFTVNEHFGTEANLRDLITAAHSKGMYVMIDVVANHVGPVGTDYSQIIPFNSAAHYHDCSGCPSSCNIEDYQNDAQTQHCRLSGLPDLNQDGNTWVKDQLISSAKYILGFGADGFRLDTVPEVSKTFWSEYQTSLGTFLIGEVWDGRMDVSASFQKAIDSVLAYPMYGALMNVFVSKASCKNLGTTYKSAQGLYKNTKVLGNFVDNHDNKRFLNMQGDPWLYKNALTYVLMGDGLPIVYYGTEQAYTGGADPENREPLWWSGYSQTADLFNFLKTTIAARKSAAVWNNDQVERYSDDTFYAFTRGTTFVALTNVGGSASTLQRTITYHPYSDGQKLCNIFWPSDDCITVASGKFDILLTHGEPKVYRPV